MTQIGTALQPVGHLYIETAPYIYFVETHPDYVGKMDAVFQQVIDRSIVVSSSVITLTEVLSHPLKQQQTRLVQEYEDILVHSTEVDLVGISVEIARSAAELRAQYNLRTPDALHIATAISAGCDAFLTNDKTLRRVNEITVLVLDDLVE